jgi:hypothetical protein
MSALGAAIAIASAAAEAIKGGFEIYKAVRAGCDAVVVRAPKGLADRARAEAERRKTKGAGR